MGLFHDIKVRLGLADDWDDEYDDEYYEDDGGDRDEPSPRSPDGFFGRRAASYESPYEPPAQSARSVRRLERDEAEREHERRRSVAPLRSVPAGSNVSAVMPQVKMHISEPRTFTEAQSIADRFKSGTPVIMNLTMTQPDLAKRLIDFASGLTYGLDGGLQKISDRVFMLTPANVDVSAEDRRRLRDKGLFNLE
ncbi:MAG: cell division protein SepF [Coriobacteriia bacterium]|nr:cell division protein SepF [Coriobacteriia bacterium]